MMSRLFLFALFYLVDPPNFSFCVNGSVAYVSCKKHTSAQADAKI